MFGLHNHHCALGAEPIHQRIGDLHVEPLLHLQAAGEPVDQPRQLGKPTNLAVLAGNVSDVSPANERKHVMFTQRCERDVLNDDQFVVVNIKLFVEMVSGIFSIAAQDLVVCLGNPFRGLLQAVAIGVFSYREEDFSNCRLNAVDVYAFAR